MPDPEAPPPELLHEFFWRAAQRWPQELAIDAPPGRDRPRQQLRYAELAEWVGGLAGEVSERATAKAAVAILIERGDPALYAAQLAVLTAGCAYVGLEPGVPDPHLGSLLDAAAVGLLLADAAGAARLRALRPQLQVLEVGRMAPGRASRFGEWPKPLRAPIAAAEIAPPQLAYLVFTSGTTGHPKAVAIEHRSVANLVAGDLAEFGLGPGDRVAQGSSPAYDSSVEEIWLALASGATLVPLDADTVRLGPDLPAWLRRERITVLCPPPTLLRAMGCREPWRELPELRLLYAGGEALPQDLAELWSRGRRFVNGYGPTECTVTVLRAEVTPGAPVAIGRPVPGATAHVLDAELQPVPDGATGELCLGGVVLARGYCDAPELTAAKFVVHPQFGRLYRSGDAVHRGPDGQLYYDGRLDAQVKIRGHRVELGEIENRIAALPGVRAAACAVREERLCAFVVSERPSAPPAFATLAASLQATAPAHCVPERWQWLAALPTTVGGKLDRRALPAMPADDPPPPVAQRDADPVLALVTAAFAEELGRPVQADDDFFALGGNSLRAAGAVSRLRGAPATAGLTVRDLYEQPTAAGLAARCRGAAAPVRRKARQPPAGAARPVLVGALQALWLCGELAVAAIAVWCLPWETWLVAEPVHLAWLAAAPLIWFASRLVAAVPAVLVVRAAKALLIGRYRAGAIPVHSFAYLRHWCLLRLCRWIPWHLLQGTAWEGFALRQLGARIGPGVHLQPGVDLRHGGWDLLELGAGTVVGRDAALGISELRDGQVHFATVRTGVGAVLEVRSGLQGGSVLGDRSLLRPLATVARGVTVPAGEWWAGVPARRIGIAPGHGAPARPQPRSSGRTARVLLLRGGAALASGLCAGVLALPVVLGWGPAGWLGLLALLLWVPCQLLGVALMLRWCCCVPVGVHPIGSFWHVLAEQRSEWLERAGHWLSGSIFWPAWLRLAGARIGRRAEISTITGTLPEQLQIGDDCFLADGIYLGGPVLGPGTVTVAPVVLGDRTFLGNHVVVPAGTALPGDLLLGVATVADPARMHAGTAWFGEPPFPLPQREVRQVDRRLTFEPGWLQRANRAYWESLRLTLPLGWAGLAWGWWVLAGAPVGALTDWLLCAVPASLGTALAAAASVWAAKWLLLGRVRPGEHGLWSCWCSRWDFLYVLWGVVGRPVLEPLCGTPWLPFYLRAMGMRIGRGVVLGPGFAQVVDPDMLAFGDGATVSTMFQAHTFEDRVLKIAPVRIGAGATLGQGSVVLYGAVVGAGAEIAPHSVVMKNEILPDGGAYAGAPVRPVA